MATPAYRDEDTGCLVHGLAIANPDGAVTDQDDEARAAIVSILAVLRNAGLIAQD